MTTPPTAVVLMAYGTPAARDDIEAYYTDIRRGRPPTPELLADLVRRYDAIGGLSPLAARTQAQRAAVAAALDRRAPGRFAVTLGFKHVAPFVEDAARAAVAAGCTQLVGLVLAPHYSAMSVGEYLQRLRGGAGPRADVRTVQSWATEPAYVAFLAGQVRARLTTMPERTTVVFTAHSLPERILASADPYPGEVLATATAVARACRLDAGQWTTAWQSAGRSPEPWLGPDISTVIDATAPGDGLLVCPCGFVADHLEVLYDLDIEAADRAAARGVAFARTAVANDDPAVADALAARVIEAAT
jgi:ferrochelatase